MAELFAALAIWWERRRRFAREWKFHREMAAADLRSLGLSPAEARQQARRRLGARANHRRAALRGIGADARSLLELLPIARAGRSPLLMPLVILVVTATVFALSPQREQILESVRGFLPFTRALPVERLIPLTPAGVVPVGFASLVLWTCVLVGLARLAALYVSLRQWRVFAYGGFLLAIFVMAGAVIWSYGLQLLLGARWGIDGVQGFALVAFGFAFPGLAFLSIGFWFRDLEQRCPRCLRALGLQRRQGKPYDVLVEPAELESVCLYGHGQATASRWKKSFACDDSAF